MNPRSKLQHETGAIALNYKVGHIKLVVTNQCLEFGVPKVPKVPKVNNNRMNQFFL